jgi:hypothetical protein
LKYLLYQAEAEAVQDSAQVERAAAAVVVVNGTQQVYQ